MNFFKRIFAWSPRGKGKSKKRRRHELSNNGGSAEMRPRRGSNSATSDAPSWPSPTMLIELGARRAAASCETLPIAQSAQTPNNASVLVIGSQETSNADISTKTPSRYSEETPHTQCNIAVTGSSSHLPPVFAVAPASGEQSADERWVGNGMSHRP